MQQEREGLRQVATFAREAGVSVRALHLYDRMGLLRPAAFTGAGYRLYGAAELERLEQILALRFIGLPLEQIKALLAEATPLENALALQREAIVRQRERLDAALAAVERAQAQLETGSHDERWSIVRNVIEVLKMENDWKWTEKYYSPEALEALERRRTEMGNDAIDQGQRDWASLIAEVESAASQGFDPASPQAQALAQRWRDLISAFTGGNAAVHEGVSSLWSDRTHWPEGFTRPWSDAAQAFISAAMKSR
jgi:MerR family transcriptional regulator, thiopeptide resistance regulator